MTMNLKNISGINGNVTSDYSRSIVNFSKKHIFEIFILLIILNIILRNSIIPHERMYDSFEMHLMANSLSEFGEARWWLHPTSIVGMYPNSYASAISFLLSGLSQLTSIDIEKMTYIYGIIVGLFTIGACYILASLFFKNEFVKFIVAFGYSTSAGVLHYSMWTANARGLFIVLLPLFLYLLLKSRKDRMKFGLLSLILFLLLFSTHHLAFYLLPVFAAFIAILIVPIVKKHVNIKVPEQVVPLLIIFLFILMISYPFLTHTFMTVGSRWDNLFIMSTEYPRYIGPLVFFSIGGLAHLIFKPKKSSEEWFLLISFAFLLVFVFDYRYMKWFSIIFAMLLAGASFNNIYLLHKNGRAYINLIVTIIILIAIIFSGYFQLVKTTNYYIIDDNSYTSGIWIKENSIGVGISNSRWDTWKIASISESPFLTGSSTVDQAYGLVDARGFELEKRDITDEKFWLEKPYARIKGLTSDSIWEMLMSRSFYDSSYSKISNRFNITYFAESVRLTGYKESHRGYEQSPFISSITSSKICVYDSGKYRIWDLT